MRPIDVEVIDDFVSPSYLKALNKAVDPHRTQWHFQGSQSAIKYNKDNLEDFGFAISLCSEKQPDVFSNTPLSAFISPLAYQMQDYIEASSIIRCRLDLTLFHRPKYRHLPHIDIHDSYRIPKYVAAIIYINDTDGDTVIYDHKQEWAESYPTNMKIKKTITPKPGRLLLFDGSYVHTGHSPSEHQTRILLNTILS